jgi:hypothetical protein
MAVKSNIPFASLTQSLADVVNNLPKAQVAINLEGLDFQIVENKLVISVPSNAAMPRTTEQCEYMQTQLKFTEGQIDRVMESLYRAVNKELVLNLLTDRVV